MFSKEDFPFVMIEVLQPDHYDHGIDKLRREKDDICENKEVVFRPDESLEWIVCWRRIKSSITVGSSNTVRRRRRRSRRRRRRPGRSRPGCGSPPPPSRAGKPQRPRPGGPIRPSQCGEIPGPAGPTVTVGVRFKPESVA